MSVHYSYSPRMHQNSEMTRSNMGSTLIPYLFDDGCCAHALFCGALEELVGAIVFHRRSSLKPSQSRAETSSASYFHFGSGPGRRVHTASHTSTSQCSCASRKLLEIKDAQPTLFHPMHDDWNIWSVRLCRINDPVGCHKCIVRGYWLL